MRYQCESRANPNNKSCRIDRYEHGERSMLMFISTVMNMWNGRCEMTLTLTDFTLHFSCSFTKLLYSKFIPLLNNFTMQEKCY